MDLYIQTDEIERKLEDIGVVVNDTSLFCEINDKAWFMGIFLGLSIQDKLVCAIPSYRDEPDDITAYLHDVRNCFKQLKDYKRIQEEKQKANLNDELADSVDTELTELTELTEPTKISDANDQANQAIRTDDGEGDDKYSIHRYALYRLENNKTIAIRYNKRLSIRMAQMENKNIPNYAQFLEESKRDKIELKIFSEYLILNNTNDGSINPNANLNIGAFVELFNEYLVKPIYVFNRALDTEEIKGIFFDLITRHGDYVSGTVSIQPRTLIRHLYVKKVNPRINKDKNLFLRNLMIYEDYMHRLNLIDNSRGKKSYVFLNGKMIQKHYEVGDFINADWFGREVGFYLKDHQKDKVVEFKPYPNRSAEIERQEHLSKVLNNLKDHREQQKANEEAAQ